MGHLVAESTVPISLENVHSDYADSDSRIEFRYSNGNTVCLLFSGGRRRDDVLEHNRKDTDNTQRLSEGVP